MGKFMVVPGGGRSGLGKGLVASCSLLLILIMSLVSCSFDYGNQEATANDMPDIVMHEVEYVRVRSGDPTARFQAERAERFEQLQKMQLWNFSFEQFGNRGEEVNAYGKAGNASIEIDTGDIVMDDGVRIDVDSEDLSIETKRLEWKDKARTLSGSPDDEVLVIQSNGTNFTGIGFRADARKRTWVFAGEVSGTYIHEDKEEDPGKDKAATEASRGGL